MSKFDRKELSPRVYAILEMIGSYTEDRHTQGSRFINANMQQKWELLEDILTDQVQEVQAEPVALAYPHEQMDALAISRYKVVPSDQSMYWRHAVVAGDGQQHLYNGSEVDCQNLARKFAGAFLDGAFAFHSLYTALQAQPADALTQAALDVLTERRRQVEVEGWTPEHDDQYVYGAMSYAAGCYAMFTQTDPHPYWPWDKAWWKPSPDQRRNFIKACALLLAEIERLDRAAVAAA